MPNAYAYRLLQWSPIPCRRPECDCILGEAREPTASGAVVPNRNVK